jgi:hypothetical protein
MIMKRIESDKDHRSLPCQAPTQAPPQNAGSGYVPGLQYRGVPQDRGRILLRIDSDWKTGVRIRRPLWLTSHRTLCETEITELHFG